MSFLLKRILGDILIGWQQYSVASDEVAEMPLTINVLGQKFLSEGLWLLTAEQHYVSVVTKDGGLVAKIGKGMAVDLALRGSGCGGAQPAG